MWADIAGAFAFLTILPVRFTPGEPGRTFAYYPLVGLVIGLILAAVAAQGWIPRDIRALLVLMAWVVITGGLHLDGFGDACDGLFATTTPERRLEIMKDSRAGSWAVIGLVLLLLGKWIALRAVAMPLLLILPPIFGRWLMVLAVWLFPPARQTGLAVHFRAGFGRTQVILATAITTLAAGIFAIWQEPNLLVMFMFAPLIVLIGRWAAGRLGGGLTGDVYGGLCELTEWVCLLAISVI